MKHKVLIALCQFLLSAAEVLERAAAVIPEYAGTLIPIHHDLIKAVSELTTLADNTDMEKEGCTK